MIYGLVSVNTIIRKRDPKRKRKGISMLKLEEEKKLEM